MSVIISTGSPSNGDGFVKVSYVEKTEQQLKESAASALIFNSNYENTLEIVAIDEFPFTNAYTTSYDTGYGDLMKAAIIATSGSTGIYADLFSYESNYFDHKYATVYFAYNTAINKAILFEGSSIEIQNYMPFTNCIGSSLKFYTRWLDPYQPSLYEVGIASLSNDSVGMEFINNLHSNILVRIKLAITIDSTNNGFRIPVPVSSNDIELNQKTFKINGTDILQKKYLAYITQFVIKSYCPNFSSLRDPIIYSPTSGFSNSGTYPGVLINGYTMQGVSAFNSVQCQLKSNSLVYTNSDGYTVPIFNNGVAPCYRNVYILDSSNSSNSIALTSANSSLIILAYSTQTVFNGAYAGICTMPYFITSREVAHVLVGLGSNFESILFLNRSGSSLTMSQSLYGSTSGWNWTVKFWIFEYENTY